VPDEVLPRSFIFLPAIGPARESALWRRGIDTWGAYRDLARVPGVKPRLKAHHDGLLDIASTRVGTDPAFFARLLPSAEHWRAYGAFARDAAYLDIETTGDRANHVTVVGVRFRGEDRAFVRGKDYSPEAVGAFLADASCLVTFNGASFDLPILQNEGVQLPQVPHADLRLVFNRLGYAGGLKKIETQLGVARADGLQGLTGWDAVKLWRKWSDRRDEAALETLVAYNIADTANLEPLARFACGNLEKKTLQDAVAQTHLAVEVTAPTP
jgi:uncharacterized protein YprB with RNaseH-like and TPR domain